MRITHRKVVVTPDNPAYPVSSGEWNDEHVDADAIDAVGDYGVVADGSTDDTVALQAAVTAWIASTTKTTLRLPAGVIKITSAITVGLMNCHRLVGAGRDVTVIRQFTANTPVLTFTAENTWGVELFDLTLEYNTQQTSGQTAGVALSFNKTGGTGSGWYYWDLRRVAFRKAQRGIAVTGTGQLPLFGFRGERLWFQDMATTAMEFKSPTVIGGMPNVWTQTIITNGGITPSSQAILSECSSNVFYGLTVTHWHGSIIRSYGGSQLLMDGVHFEHCEIDAEFTRLFDLSDTGFTTIHHASLTVQVDAGSGNWIFLIGSGMHLHFFGVYADFTNTGGASAKLLNAAAGSFVRGMGFIDQQANITEPGDVDGAANVNVAL